MRVESLELKYMYYDGMELRTEGVFHRKTLPCFSIVQACKGSYGIRLGGLQEYNTGEHGAFLAPAGVLQEITHHVNPESRIMQAQWIFLDVRINGQFRLEDLYDFPVLVPQEDQDKLSELFSRHRTSQDIFERYSSAYLLLKLLFKIGREKQYASTDLCEILTYLEEHYADPISVGNLAAQFGWSGSTLLRRFHRELSQTPGKYLMELRLSHAALLLQTTQLTISAIAEQVGIADVFYFSKLFHKGYGLSPTRYRKDYHE